MNSDFAKYPPDFKYYGIFPFISSVNASWFDITSCCNMNQKIHSLYHFTTNLVIIIPVEFCSHTSCHLNGTYTIFHRFASKRCERLTSGRWCSTILLEVNPAIIREHSFTVRRKYQIGGEAVSDHFSIHQVEVAIFAHFQVRVTGLSDSHISKLLIALRYRKGRTFPLA